MSILIVVNVMVEECPVWLNEVRDCRLQWVWVERCCSFERSGEEGGRVDGGHHKRLLVTVEVSETWLGQADWLYSYSYTCSKRRSMMNRSRVITNVTSKLSLRSNCKQQTEWVWETKDKRSATEFCPCIWIQDREASIGWKCCFNSWN
jgi:hypothetical protein